MGPFLFSGLVALGGSLVFPHESFLTYRTVMTGFVQFFIPFNRTMELIYAIGGCLIFSGYVVYDTYIINSKLSPDEYIMGAISLYLEYVSAFLHPVFSLTIWLPG
jgi:protein lifeguard